MICDTRFDLPYLPMPNKVDTVISDLPAPAELTSTGFVFAIMPDKSLVLARNARRGLEIPGGHIEAGETAIVAARREAFEEAGCTFDEIIPLGYLNAITTGQRPINYKYPYPNSYQQFFTGLVQEKHQYVENDECLTPVVVAPKDVPKHLNKGMVAFYNHAVTLLFG